MKKGSHILKSSSSSISRAYINKLLQDTYHTSPENNPDVLILSPNDKKESVGIDQIRIANTYCTLRPHHYSHKSLIIYSAHKMTVQAQNAFLKTLEDMGTSMLIILETSSPDKLLDTIRSRCKLINLTNKRLEDSGAPQIRTKNTSSNNKLDSSMTIQQKLSWAEELSKEDLDTILEALSEIGLKIKANMGQGNLYSLEILLEVADAIQNTNTNKRFALEYFAMALSA